MSTFILLVSCLGAVYYFSSFRFWIKQFYRGRRMKITSIRVLNSGAKKPWFLGQMTVNPQGDLWK